MLCASMCIHTMRALCCVLMPASGCFFFKSAVDRIILQNNKFSWLCHEYMSNRTDRVQKQDSQKQKETLFLGILCECIIQYRSCTPYIVESHQKIFTQQPPRNTRPLASSITSTNSPWEGGQPHHLRQRWVELGPLITIFAFFGRKCWTPSLALK